MKYKIGEVSRMLNIPVDTLRYYESKQFVSPEKDKYNNYRWYRDWDIFYLLEYKKYRSVEFSMPEIKAIVDHDTMNDFIARIEKKSRGFKERKQYYGWMEQRLKEFGEALRRAREELWQCAIVNNTGFYYILQADEEISRKNLFLEEKEFLAFLNPVIYIKLEDALKKEEKEKYLYGSALSGDWEKRLPVRINPKARYFYAEQMLHTIIRTGEEGTFS
ncbi:MAG: MerR family transcriptional regulator, partial [Treponema sp.]|nr:MerR family transcriptional regulator [Treponema sp.]